MVPDFVLFSGVVCVTIIPLINIFVEEDLLKTSRLQIIQSYIFKSESRINGEQYKYQNQYFATQKLKETAVPNELYIKHTLLLLFYGNLLYIVLRLNWRNHLKQRCRRFHRVSLKKSALGYQ